MAKRKKIKKTGLKILLTFLVIFGGAIASLYFIFKHDNKSGSTKKDDTKVVDKKEKEKQKKEDEKKKLEEQKRKEEEEKLKKEEEEKKKKEEDKNKKKTYTSSKQSRNKGEYPALTELDGEKKVIGTSDNGYTIYTRSGVTYIDGIMIVNKTYGLPEDYIPTNTHATAEGRTNTCNTCINEVAYQSFDDMKADAAALGLNIYIQSGYRPYITQQKLYNNYVNRDGKAAADTYSARPGHSEHQSGLCFDLNSISDSFANTNEGIWVNENAYKYGFVIRFPKGKQDYTGYKYESWHLRYVGTELAEKLYNNGDWLSLEEYFGISSEYTD